MGTSIMLTSICLSLFCVHMQNPVNTMLWLNANFQLLGPIISLTIETRLFVQPIFRTAPLLILSVVYTVFANLALMTGPAVHANAFRLYHLPQKDRFQIEGLGVAAVVYFYLCITITRRLLKRYQQHKIQPS